MGFQAGGLYRQGDDSDVDCAVLQLLHDLIAKITINTDLDLWIQMAVLSEDVGQYVQAGRLICADDQRAPGTTALVGHREQ